MVIKLKVADHLFTISMPDRDAYMLKPYEPFISNDTSEELFSVELVERLDCVVTRTLIEDIEQLDDSMVRVNIYETTEGLLYNIIMPHSEEVSGSLHVVGRRAMVTLRDGDGVNRYQREIAFTNTMVLSYMTQTATHNTLLLHASAIMRGGRAYLFIGKSGTGKSTHTRMWQESFADAELLNDDHPVVRCFEGGEVIAYGSPWSGKTPCYRDLSAPLSAIVRIKRAEYNRLNRLSTIRGYASVMTSCSALQWSRAMSEAKAKSLEMLITNVSCCEMECLPNRDAAICCYESLCDE